MSKVSMSCLFPALLPGTEDPQQVHAGVTGGIWEVQMSGVHPKPIKSETLGAELRHGLLVLVPQAAAASIQGWEPPSQKAFLCLPDLVFLEH